MKMRSSATWAGRKNARVPQTADGLRRLGAATPRARGRSAATCGSCQYQDPFTDRFPPSACGARPKGEAQANHPPRLSWFEEEREKTGLAGHTQNFAHQARRSSTRKKSAAPATRLLPHRAVEALRAAGRARRGEGHRAALFRDRDREARAIPVGQRGRSLDGVASSHPVAADVRRLKFLWRLATFDGRVSLLTSAATIFRTRSQLHLAILPRGRPSRFAARLGEGEELLRRRVPQFLHRARGSLEAHPPAFRQSQGTQFVWTTR